jgi:hypothetical protein
MYRNISPLLAASPSFLDAAPALSSVSETSGPIVDPNEFLTDYFRANSFFQQLANAPQQARGQFPYVDDFKNAMEVGRLRSPIQRGYSMPTDNPVEGGFNAVNQGLNVIQQKINNPLVRMAMGQPLTFKDESGVVSFGPGENNQMLVFQAQQNTPGGWGGTIDVPNRSVSLNKGMFDVSAGLGPTDRPDQTVRVGFDTSRMNAPQDVPQQIENQQEEGLVNRYSPVVYQDPYNGRQPSPGELERDQVINQYRESDPYWYRVGTGVR